MSSGVLLKQKAVIAGTGITVTPATNGTISLSITTNNTPTGYVLVKTEGGIAWGDPADNVSTAIAVRAPGAYTEWLQRAGLSGDGTVTNPLGVDIPQIKSNEEVYWIPYTGGWGVRQIPGRHPDIGRYTVCTLLKLNATQFTDATFSDWLYGTIIYNNNPINNRACVMIDILDNDGSIIGFKLLIRYQASARALYVARMFGTITDAPLPYQGSYFYYMGGGTWHCFSNAIVNLTTPFIRTRYFGNAVMTREGDIWAIRTTTGELIYTNADNSSAINPPATGWEIEPAELSDLGTFSFNASTTCADVEFDRALDDWTDITPDLKTNYPEWYWWQYLIRCAAFVTFKGNVFNGVNQLVELDASGKLPAIDGSNLTNISSGGTAAVVPITVDTTLSVNNVGDTILVTAGTTVTATLPTDAAVGSVYRIVKNGSGTVKIKVPSGVTIMDSTDGGYLVCDLAATAVFCTIQKITTTTWLIVNATGVWYTE